MKTPEETIKYLNFTLDQMLKRPLMYADTAIGFETQFLNNINLLAMIRIGQ